MLLTIDGHVSKLDTEDPLIPEENAWGRRKATVIAVKRPAQDSSDRHKKRWMNVWTLGFQGASRPSSISTIKCGFICEHLLFVQYKTKQKKFADFIIFFLRILKF